MKVRSARSAWAIGLVLLPALPAVVTGCLAEPPGHLPSSIRILYSKAARDSLGERVDVWFLLARQGNELRLTEEDAHEVEPTFALGPRRVFYVREEEEGSEIWSIDLGGGDERLELAGAGDLRDPDVSPDGARLAYTRVADGRSTVLVAALDGTPGREVTTGPGSWSQPRWSADGRRLVVVGGQGAASRLHLVDPDDGEPRPITAGATTVQADPDWNPDGTRIVFRQGEGAAAEIAVVSVDGGGQVTVLTDNDVEDGDPAFSPTGERIVFVSRRPDGRPNLWVMDADGSDVESLTTMEEGEEAADPDWL